MLEYYVCTYGNFPDRKKIVEESLQKNIFMLHTQANYPSALNCIKKGDVILLKEGSWIVAYGNACDAVTDAGQNGWKYQVQVDEWTKCDPPIHSYGISWNTIQGGQMSVVKKVKPEWAIDKLSLSKKNAITIEVNNNKVTCQTVFLTSLLQMNLAIPEYQRGYGWDIQNVIDFLEDIHSWFENATTKDYDYHLGSIILKISEKGFDIIDGQQRLVTLTIWAHLMKNGAQKIPLLNSTLKANYQKSEVKQSILRARELIKNSNYKILFDKIILSVILIGKELPDDLAYTFFSNSNSTGKRLSDYDLLKTHHLRYIDEESTALKIWTRWHNFEKSNLQDELLHQILFRLRCWRSGSSFHLNAADTPERDLYNHYAAQSEGFSGFPNYPSVKFSYDSILSGGREFFDYTEYYRKDYETFNNLAIINELQKALSYHSNGVIYAGIKAIAFLFYCKFGDMFLDDAVYVLSYRLSELRNESRVMGRYLSSKIFQKYSSILDRVTSEGEFMAIMLESKQRYLILNRGKTAQNYWNSLKVFLEKFEDNMLLSIPEKFYLSNSFKQEES